MRARFLGKDPESQVENSSTLFAIDRTDRVTYIAQGWKVTDPAALAPHPGRVRRPPGRG